MAPRDQLRLAFAQMSHMQRIMLSEQVRLGAQAGPAARAADKPPWKHGLSHLRRHPLVAHSSRHRTLQFPRFVPGSPSMCTPEHFVACLFPGLAALAGLPPPLCPLALPGEYRAPGSPALRGAPYPSPTLPDPPAPVCMSLVSGLAGHPSRAATRPAHAGRGRPALRSGAGFSRRGSGREAATKAGGPGPPKPGRAHRQGGGGEASRCRCLGIASGACGRSLAPRLIQTIQLEQEVAKLRAGLHPVEASRCLCPLACCITTVAAAIAVQVKPQLLRRRGERGRPAERRPRTQRSCAASSRRSRRRWQPCKRRRPRRRRRPTRTSRRDRQRP